jgi:polyphosphate kinase
MPASEPPAPKGAPDGAPRTLDRELSLLDFHARVLSLAEDQALPLLERAKFLAIFSQSLDEFFQVRVGGLKDRLEALPQTVSPEGRGVAGELSLIRQRVDELAERQGKVFTAELVPALEQAGIRFSGWDELDDEDREYLNSAFSQTIFPVLTPLAVDPAHPFPYISNLSLNLAVVVRDPDTKGRKFARVKVPPLLPRFSVLPDGERFVSLETVISTHLDALFPGMEIVAHYPFRVTRDADIELAEEEADLAVAVERALRRRRRAPRVVRLEVDSAMSEEVRILLARELEIGPQDVYVTDGTLDLGGLWSLYDLDRPELKYEPWVPITQPRLHRAAAEPGGLFEAIAEGDILVHHPYDSFSTSVEAFLYQAAHDPDVLAIKQTLYRTSGKSASPIVNSLIEAAEAGKQVVALVELTARFDEQANLTWARALEEAGVHVVYGVVGLKTHVKISLVVRREGAGIKRYCHIGTGNYNPNTATQYEDAGLLSADQKLGADLTDLFNYLTGYSGQKRYRKLLVAPLTLRPRLLALIEEEARRGPAGRIVMKVNSLVDEEVVEALYAASAAGTRVDLLVRGMCVLRPGVPGLSSNIRVRSIVGRYLEHSRIFRFGTPPNARTFIGSADLMPRNLDRRVEGLAPISDANLRTRLDEALDLALDPETRCWDLEPDGTWTRGRGEMDTQRRLQASAIKRGGGAGASA